MADTIGEHLRGFLGDQMICLLQSFIYPKKMMVMPLQQQGVGDPIFELFNPPAGAKEGRFAWSVRTHAHELDAICPLTPPDQLEIQLRHALANMVAAVLACPPRSNHLWYHLFAANELNDTHMTGFMVRVIFTSY